jgi:hypothetical protein
VIGSSNVAGFARLTTALNEVTQGISLPSCNLVADAVTVFVTAVATRMMKGPVAKICGGTFQADKRLSVYKLVSDDLMSWAFATSMTQSLNEATCLASFASQLRTDTPVEPTLTAFCDPKTYPSFPFVYKRLKDDLWAKQFTCIGTPTVTSTNFLSLLSQFLLSLRDSSAVCSVPALPPLNSAMKLVALFNISGDFLPHLVSTIYDASIKTCLEDVAIAASPLDIDISLSFVCGVSPVYSNRAELTRALKTQLQAKLASLPLSCGASLASTAHDDYSKLVSAFVFSHKASFCTSP